MTEKRLSQHLRRNTRVLGGGPAAISPAAGSVLETRDFKVMAQAIFEVCKTAIGATIGQVVLLSEDGTDEEVLSLHTGDGHLAGTVLRMPLQGLRDEACRDAKVVYDNRLSTGRQNLDPPSGPIELSNVLFAPLVIENTVAGLLCLANIPTDFNRRGTEQNRPASSWQGRSKGSDPPCRWLSAPASVKKSTRTNAPPWVCRVSS